MKSGKWGDVVGLGLLGLLGIFLLSNMVQNPKLNPNLRFIAQTAEGQLVQDMETGLLHLLV